MKATIETGKEDPSLFFENLEVVNDEVSCFIDIRSKGFSARRPFYFSALSRMISELKKIDSELSGRVVFSEPYGENKLILECDKFGHIIVSGSLVLQAEEHHSINFSFVTDQTCLKPFILDLSVVLKSDGSESQ